LLALVLAGCVNVEPASTPDGKGAHSITCSGNSRSWTDCHEKAAEICGAKRYAIVAGGPQPGLGDAREGGLLGGTSASRNMVVQCKP
jgi:hypothetical protein